MTAKKNPIPEKKAVEPKAKVEETPQYLTDIETLKKTVAHLEQKAKSQNEQTHIIKSICDSWDGIIKKLQADIKKVAVVAGVAL